MAFSKPCCCPTGRRDKNTNEGICFKNKMHHGFYIEFSNKLGFFSLSQCTEGQDTRSVVRNEQTLPQAKPQRGPLMALHTIRARVDPIPSK